MSNAAMPEPVALTNPKITGVTVYGYTAEQMEAYAEAKAREVLEIKPVDKAMAIYDEGVKNGLEAAAKLVDGRRSNGLSTDLRSIVNAIRSCIPIK